MSDLCWTARPGRELLRLAWPITISTVSFSTMTLASTAFVAFINVDGGIMYKVFLARDENGSLRREQMAQFGKLSADATR